MAGSSALGGLLTTLFDRRPFGRKFSDNRPMVELCDALLAEETDVASPGLAIAALNRYAELDPDQKIAFFGYLNDSLDLDADEIARLAMAFSENPSVENYRALAKSSDPKRQELLRRLNQAPGGTSELVQMRTDLLALVNQMPELARTDHDFEHLLKSWFNGVSWSCARSHGTAPRRFLRKSSPMRPCMK